MASTTKTTEQDNAAVDTYDPADDIDPETGEVITEEDTVGGTLDVLAIINSLNDGSRVVSTIKGDDFDARVRLAEALTSSEPIIDHINERIDLVDYVVQAVDLPDQRTGEVKPQPRIVLIGADGQAYHGTSVGLLTSIRNLRVAMGDLFGSKPLPIKVVQQRSTKGIGNFFTIKFVK